MGSDDTHVTDPVLPVQEPESASAAQTTPSDNGGGSDGSEASSPSSRRHQEQVQNLKGKCEVMDAPDDNLIDETKVPDKELGSASVASMGSDRADPTPSDNNSGGDGSGAPCLWSLSQEEHVWNLKNNCRHAFYLRYPPEEWAGVEDSPWFARVVAQLRADPCLDSSQLEMKEAPFGLKWVGPLHLAVLMGDLEMVQKILETRSEPNEVNIDALIELRRYLYWIEYSALDLAIVGGKSEIVDALLEKNAKVNSGDIGSLQLAVACARAERTENTFKIIQSLVLKGMDINAKDDWGFSAFYLAVVQGKSEIVNELLSRWEDKIHLNEACCGGRPPIQIAHEEGFKDIESALMKCNDVKWFIDTTIRERQGFVDTSNAILVGAAFIASATFASWLQPPLNYTTSYHGSSVEYVDVEHNAALGWFWVFNILSFSFAIGTVVLGASSVLPRRGLFITENVRKLSQNLVVTSILLAFSMLFVVVAFGIAGLIVLIPILRYQWYMIVPMIFGGIVCVGSIGYLFKSLWKNRPGNIRRRKKNTFELQIATMLYGYNDDVEERLRP